MMDERAETTFFLLEAHCLFSIEEFRKGENKEPLPEFCKLPGRPRVEKCLNKHCQFLTLRDCDAEEYQIMIEAYEDLDIARDVESRENQELGNESID